MLLHAYAPSNKPPPDLWYRYCLVERLHLGWDDVGGLAADELPLLGELMGIWDEAAGVKGRVEATMKARR